MILRPRSALTASMSCFISRIRSSIGRCSSNAAGSDDLRLASASRLLFFLFMRLVCLGLFFIHRQACLLGGQTTNRIFNYAADIPGFSGQVVWNVTLCPTQNSGVLVDKSFPFAEIVRLCFVTPLV